MANTALNLNNLYVVPEDIVKQCAKAMQDDSENTFKGDKSSGKGLWPAITEFLEENDNWELHERFTNNNGITILKRK